MPSSRLAFHTAAPGDEHEDPRGHGDQPPAERQLARPRRRAPAAGARRRGAASAVVVVHGPATVPPPAAAGIAPLPCPGVTTEPDRSLDRRRRTARPQDEVLSIFFPMWNEEHYVERAVDAARRVCDALVADGEIADYELLIVDDASTDRTPELADALAAADRHVRVIHHERNRKLGGSMKTGFANATGDLILYSDADLPVRHGGRGAPGRAAAARVRGRHGQRLPLRPHRRGLPAGDLHVLLQPDDPLDVQDQGPRHQLRVQALPAPHLRARAARRARARSSTPSCSSAPPASATRCCRSASTTSRAPAASRRSPRRASSSRSCARCGGCAASCVGCSRRADRPAEHP